MSNILWKHFYLCLSKLKCFPTCLPPPPPPSNQDYTLQSQPLINTFNPLSNLTTSDLSTSTSGDFFSSSSSSDDTDRSPPDMAAIFASHRFFFPSPGQSNSIVDSPDPDPDPLVAGGVAVQTDSPDPFTDFRRSMQEMVDARQLLDVKADWEYLHELLLCYLSLNPKHTHEFIFEAFSDLLVSLMSSNATGKCRRKSESRRRAAVARRLM